MGCAIFQNVNSISRATECKIELRQVNFALNFRFGRDDAGLARQLLRDKPVCKSNHAGQPHSACSGPGHGGLKPVFRHGEELGFGGLCTGPAASLQKSFQKIMN